MYTVPKSSRYLAYAATAVIVYPLVTTVTAPFYTRDEKAKNRTAIITGANGNIGAALTLALAKRDFRVIMACRDMDKCKSLRREIVLETRNSAVACRHLDLEDIDSINKFASEMINEEPHIDILINNAGVKEVKERELTAKYGIEKNLFVNYLGPFLLTFRLLDKLKESSAITRDSRIINVIGKPKKSWKVDLEDPNFEKRKYSALAAYRQSKMALAYFTILLDKYNRQEKNLVYVYGVDYLSFNIVKSMYRPDTMWEHFKWYFAGLNNYHPDRLVGVVVRCAMDQYLANSECSGKLYSYAMRTWGWGAADKDENKAKHVWNLATKLLLKIEDPKKEEKTPNVNPEPDKVEPT